MFNFLLYVLRWRYRLNFYGLNLACMYRMGKIETHRRISSHEPKLSDLRIIIIFFCSLHWRCLAFDILFLIYSCMRYTDKHRHGIYLLLLFCVVSVLFFFFSCGNSSAVWLCGWVSRCRRWAAISAFEWIEIKWNDKNRAESVIFVVCRQHDKRFSR